MKRAVRIVTCVVCLWVLGSACDSADGPGDPVAGTVTFGADEGVDFFTGKTYDPGHFANSDLFASRSGDGLKLATGGDDPTDNRPVNWFKSGGGVSQTFASLAEVPTDRPTDVMVEPLVKAKTGNGFLVQRADGGYTRGWIASADGGTVTIEFAPAP